MTCQAVYSRFEFHLHRNVIRNSDYLKNRILHRFTFLVLELIEIPAVSSILTSVITGIPTASSLIFLFRNNLFIESRYRLTIYL